MSDLLKVFKFVFIGLILWIIYSQMIHGSGLEALRSSLEANRQKWNYSFLIICFVLMPLNWIMESKKWQILMSPHTDIPFIKALKTVLAGIAVGITTPARIGEYGGRLLTSAPDQKLQVVSATLLGSIAQNLCNVVAGLVFSYFFLKSAFNVTYGNSFTFITIVTLQIVLFVIVYYNLPKVAHFIEKIIGTKYAGKYSSKLKSLHLYQSKSLHYVLIISAIRYSLYFTQYVCMMKFLGVEATMPELSGSIAGIYLIQTGIPLPAFLSIFARGELAIFVWSGLGVDQVTALVATFVLWFINLILPAMAGLMVLFNTDLVKYFNKKQNNESSF
ncbi:MAG: flippase-like domain-containing protein [Saprospiraceae bacterium]|nr:flippase-like domain-containing protein [Saprospiraceae bacterium]